MRLHIFLRSSVVHLINQWLLGRLDVKYKFTSLHFSQDGVPCPRSAYLTVVTLGNLVDAT